MERSNPQRYVDTSLSVCPPAPIFPDQTQLSVLSPVPAPKIIKLDFKDAWVWKMFQLVSVY
jgi:hypothetical protein